MGEMFKNNLKRIFFILLYLINKKKYLNNIKRNNFLVILNLHKIAPNNNEFYPSLEPDLFEELLKFITHYFNVTTFRNLDRDSKKPNLILSFDDGFYDFLEYGDKIMQKYNVSANLNIIPHAINTNLPQWDVQISDILNSLTIDEINNLKLIDFKLNEHNRDRFFLKLLTFIKNADTKAKNYIFNIFEQIKKEKNIKYTKMLSLEDVKKLSLKYEIGCHSYYHKDFKYLTTQKFEEDFNKCQDFFKNNLNIPIDIYAFPYGSYKQDNINYLQKKKVRHILLVDENYSKLNENIYNRFTFHASSKFELKLKSLGWRRDNEK
jgi:peptidoglycan/xylan/chitin deacetylase (PgdA/CDA1 family)